MTAATNPPQESKTTPRRWRRWLGKLVLLAVSTGVSLLLAEGVVRLMAPQQLIQLRPDVWQANEAGLGWQQAPNVDTRMNTGEREIRFFTDTHGHRVGEAPRIDDPQHRILALGDSFLAAIQVDFEDTMTQQLAELLSERLGESVEVVNTGVGGWGPSHYRIKAEQQLSAPADGDPYDLVLVFLFLGNDVETWRREAFEARASSTRHFRWPRNLRPGELVNAWLYPINDGLETRSHLFMLARNQTWQMLMRLGLSARKLDSAFLRQEAEAERWDMTAAQCRELDEIAASHDLETLFVLLPAAVQVDEELGKAYAQALGHAPEAVDYDQPTRLMTERLRELGVEFVDLTEPMRQDFESRDVHLHGKVDTHLSPDGHTFVAQTLEDRVASLLQQKASAPMPTTPPTEPQP